MLGHEQRSTRSAARNISPLAIERSWERPRKLQASLGPLGELLLASAVLGLSCLPGVTSSGDSLPSGRGTAPRIPASS